MGRLTARTAYAVAAGTFANVFEHYKAFGESENRAPTSTYASFDAAGYLEANADVAAAVTAGAFSSALDHFIQFGQGENRSGSGVSNTVVTTGETFTLTTGVDNFTGTSNNDTFTADNSGTNPTSSSADSLTGGEGTDTLNLFTKGTAASAAIPTISGIEIINIYDMDIATTIATKTGVTNYNIFRGEGDDTFTMAAGVSVGVNEVAIGTGNGNAALTVAFNNSDTTANVSLNGVTDADNDANEDLVLTGTGLTTLNLSTSGTASNFDALDVAAIKTISIDAAANLTVPIETTGTAGTITVTGAGAVNLGALDTGITTVDASANTGGLTITDQAAATVITGSATGNDSVNVGTLAKSAAVTLGDSTGDRIIFTDDTNYTTTAAQISGAEILRAGGVGSSYDLTKLSGISSIEVIGTGGTVTMNKLSSTQANAITAQNNVTTLVTTLSDSSGTADSVSVTIDDVDTTASAITVGAITAAGVETLNLVSGDTGVTHVVSALTSSTALKTINVSGTSNLTITDMTAAASGATVNASDFSKNLIVGIGAGDKVIAGSGDDGVSTAFANLSNTLQFTGGAGDDTLTVSGNGSDLEDGDFALISGVDNIVIGSATGTTVTLGGFAQAAIGTVDKNTDGLMDFTATSLTTSGTVNAGAMTTAGVDVTMTITNADGGGAQAATLTGGAANDKFTLTLNDTNDADNDDNLTGVITGNDGIDTITITQTATDAADVISVVSTETSSANADIITGWTVNNATSVFDYNGTVQAAAGTAEANATLAGGIGSNAGRGTYIVQTDVANTSTNTQGSAFNDVLNSTASNLATNYAELEAQLLATGGALNGTVAGLDAAVTASEAVLLALDNGTGSVILRLTNTTATNNTIEAGEIDLIAVITDATALTSTDFA